MKAGKSNGNKGLNSDNVIHGTNELLVSLVLLFHFLHGYSPDSMILGSFFPRLKYKRDI